ncbi:MAG TPA: hypothetical protein ENO08_00575 [Candidatus Eisenbacteria bacterium]|uniref:SH3 domain-containing protein n=1 Tax=Eiseniibacteriota bacterium TaxID=2212470 RepID=A0A7V2ATF4_UNCEI|nr:hypothetical protein [Candidatus Eisenbacteria bacterium]
MNRMKKSLTAVAALALLATIGIARDAEAEIRVSAALHTPGLSVRIGNAPAGPYGSIRVGHLPVRANMRYRIVERDRLIAGRLAWYTGVPVRELVRLRAYGYTWFEIGAWLRLPKAVVQASFNHNKWSRFTRGGGKFAGHGAGHGKHHKVIVYNH